MRLTDWLVAAGIIALILALTVGCTTPRVYRLGPGEGLVLHEKDSIICVGVECERLWRDK